MQIRQAAQRMAVRFTQGAVLLIKGLRPRRDVHRTKGQTLHHIAIEFIAGAPKVNDAEIVATFFCYRTSSGSSLQLADVGIERAIVAEDGQ